MTQLEELRRPVGLQILIGVDCVVFGLGQLWNLFKDSQRASPKIDSTEMAIVAGFAIITIIAAVWAYVGGEVARKVLFVVGLLNVFWFIYEFASILLYERLASLWTLAGIVIIAKPLIAFIGNIWYLNSP